MMIASRRSGARLVAGVAVAAVLGLVPPSGVRTFGEEVFRCELKEAGALHEADARTATRVLCEQLRQHSGGRGAFDVSLGTLGRLVVVTVLREDTGMSVSVRLEEIEELPVAAQRVAAALVEGRPFAATGRVDNLIASETRAPRTRDGSLKFSAGIADVESPGHGARASGLSLGLAYSSSRFALPVELRFGWDDAPYGEGALDFFAFSIGGRGFLSTRDISPFVGGGLGYLTLEARDGSYPEPGQPAGSYFSADRRGVSPYVEGGVEFLRTHRGRLALVLRADIPLGPLEQPAIPVTRWDSRGRTEIVVDTVPARSKYVVPVSIGVSVAF